MSTNQIPQIPVPGRIESEKQKVGILNSMWTLAVSFVFVGPFCLPLLWRNPRFTARGKWIATFLILGATALLMVVFGGVLRDTYQQVEQLKQLMEQAQ